MGRLAWMWVGARSKRKKGTGYIWGSWWGVREGRNGRFAANLQSIGKVQALNVGILGAF